MVLLPRKAIKFSCDGHLCCARDDKKYVSIIFLVDDKKYVSIITS